MLAGRIGFVKTQQVTSSGSLDIYIVSIVDCGDGLGFVIFFKGKVLPMRSKKQ